MVIDNRSREELLAENKELRYRLEEAEETLHALGSGAADALVISMPEGGEQVFTLQGAEQPYRVLIETMSEGAVTLTSDGTILYCNSSMAALLQVPLEKLIGSVLLSYVAPADSALFAVRLESSMREPEKGEISLLSGVGHPTPVLFSCCSVELPGSRGINVLFTDITELKQAETQLQLAAERECAAEVLRDHQERLALAADAGQVGMFEVNMGSGDVYWTQKQEKIFGYEPTTTSNTTTAHTYQEWSDRVHPDDLSKVEERMRQAMEEKIPFQVEYRIVWPNGSIHWINVTSRYYFDDSGRCTRLLGAVRDITESKRVGDALRESEDRFRTLADNIPQLCWMANFDGGVFWYNKRWHEYTGTTSEQMEGWGWHSVLDPEILPQALEQWKDSIATGKPFDMTFPLRGSDGIFRPFLTRIMPVHDQEGKIVKWFGTNTDVTAQKLTEETLRNSEQRYRTIGESIDYGVWVCAPDGRNIYASESFLNLIGITQKQCSSFGWGEMLHPDDSERTIAAWKECVQAGEKIDIEHRFRGVDGQWHPILTRGSPIRDEQGQLTGWAGINLDISQLKQVETHLKASLLEKEVLLKEIHHRVKNNMQVISSLVNLQAKAIDNPEVRLHLQDVRDRVRSMALVHEKLYQTENLAKVPFDEYVGSLLNYLKNAYDKSEATIQYTMDLQSVSLSVEKAVPCGLMLNELITNALKHAFGGRTNGQVTTALHRTADGTVCLRVSDDGVGMPLEQDWRKSKSLGLRLVDMLARQLNAIVELNCDKGTQFQIAFKPSETAEGGGQPHE